MHARRRDAGDERALDQAAGRLRSAAGDDPRPSLQGCPEGHSQPQRRLGGEVDVDEAGHRSPAAEGRGRARLPDQVAVDLGAGLDLLERVDADARQDDALGPERTIVPDRRSLVDAGVRADVARAAEDRALDQDAAAR